MSIVVKSAAFDVNQRIPVKFTGEGNDVSPSISWSGVPGNAKSLAIVCEDPDVKDKEHWVHWVMFNIPVTVNTLPEGVSKIGQPLEIKDAVQGKNDFGRQGYEGPLPPQGDGVHHYHFKVFALDSKLDLKEDATETDLLKVMQEHILDRGEIVGTYERK